MIPIHPEPLEDRDALRWVMPAGTLRGRGAVSSAPGRLGELMGDGTLAGIAIDGCSVVTRLGSGHSWADDGATVRTALHGALERPDEWRAEIPECPEDELLLDAVRTVLDGRVGDFIRSHGGDAEVVSAIDGVATVRLRGACSGCPAAGFTLHARLERAVRERYPGLRDVVAV
ncbi:MAG TPA: NifU family protein [Lacisediminihabitans sp.]|uniref:NifU family protein n=1 Tax=Lacisediminihabitans sp. TaxID=2787631 RepID=UPI002EDABFDF